MSDSGTAGGSVVRTFLELRTPDALSGVAWPAADVRLVRRDGCTVAEYRALYAAIGGPWAWRDRDAWSDAELAAHLERPAVTVWVVVEGAGDSPHAAPAGYFELVRHDDGSVEIAYFGLASRLHGRRLGAALLTAAARAAWAMGASRVWLHTCTLDAPAALPNYLARGFVVVRRERYSFDRDSTGRAQP